MNQKHFSPAAPLAPDTSNEQIKFFATGFNKLELAALLVYHATTVLIESRKDIGAPEFDFTQIDREFYAQEAVKIAESILEICDLEREKFIIESTKKIP